MKSDYYSYLKENISIDEVCGKLGILTIRKGNNNVAICPFHNDTNPSLTLYQEQYHCFACGAHGDIFSLVKKVKNYEFYKIIDWLENEFPYVTSKKPEATPIKKYINKNGFSIAYDSYKQMNSNEIKLLEKFSETRKYAHQFLMDCEIFYAQKNKLSKKYENDIECRNLLIDKYLIKEQVLNEGNNTPISYVDSFMQGRTIITLRDYNNMIIGFAGRANQDEKPKYLFTKELPKSKFLYRLNEVKNRCMTKTNKEQKLDLYIVEGVFDALRLEEKGLDAVAVLGSHITQSQVLILEQFLNDISKDNKSINIHIFLDSDQAGISGALKSIRNLWLNDTTRRSYVTAIVNRDAFQNISREKRTILKDPDEILISSDVENSQLWISNHEIKVFEFLMRYLYNPDNLIFDEDSFKDFYQEKLDVSQRIDLLGKVIGIISDKYWLEIIERYSAIEFDCFELEICKSYFGLGKAKTAINEKGGIKSYKAAFQIATEIARNSYLKEDVPIDEFTWTRIMYCADVFYDYFYKMLKKKEHLRIPMLSIKMPKNYTEYRLKTLYSHEQLIMQQYVLNEILREDKYRKYELFIPAVRYNPNRVNTVYTTGLDCYNFYNNSEDKAVSFAYQINMPVINGDFRSNEGMFRPFYDCWKDFIIFIQEGIDKIPSDIIYKIKLDIRKFYENITNYSVRNTLLPMLKEALGTVDNRFNFMNEDETNADSKENSAKYVVEWIISELFDYKYYSSKDGKEKSSDNALIGIPQGPNLSAYIANILLFKLDKAVAEYVGNINDQHKKNNFSGIAVRYARYVDDMVVVADNPKYLNDIKDIIRNELSVLELELSPKTDDAEKTTKENAYEWLTSEKGGLGVSSIFDFADESTESVIEEYEEYETLDRRNALKLLYNMTVDFNYIDCEEKENIILSFFKTQDVRYNDIVRFSEMLIRYNIRNTPNSESDIFSGYEQIWEQGCVQSLSNSMFKRKGIMCLSFLQGCINILKGKESISMGIEEVEQRKKDKLLVAEMVTRKNTIKKFKNYISDSEILQENLEVLNIKFLQLLNMVFENSKPDDTKQIEQFINGLKKHNEYVARWIYFTYYNTGCNINFQLDENYGNANKTLYYFHYCVSNMMIITDITAYNTIRSSIKFMERDFKLNLEDNFAKCMLIWFWEGEDYTENDTNIALSLLVNLVKSEILSNIIDKNNALKKCLFKENSDEKRTHYLPAPPGIEYPGIFAVIEIAKGQKVKRADFIDYTEQIENLDWKEESLTDCKCKIKTAELVGKWESISHYLCSIQDINEKIINIAEVYKQLYTYIKLNDNKLILSKFHTYVAENKIRVLSYKINNEMMNLSVAISQGSNSLIIKQVSEIGCEYWQAGNILRDALQIDKIIISNNNTDEDFANQMLYYSFDRLTGDTINKNYINKSNRSYEKSITRTINALKEFAKVESNKKIFITDCIMTNNFINYRMNQYNYEFANGEVEYRLAIWSKNYLNRNYINIQESYFQDFVIEDNCDASSRRAALAYFKIGNKFSLLARKYLNMESIKMIAAGFFSESVLVNLRMQVLERIYLLEENERNNFKDREYPYVFLKFDVNKICLLVNSNNQLEDLKNISDNLLNRKYDSRIKDITHIGWLLLLSWLLEIDELANYIIIDRKKSPISESLKHEIIQLKKYFLSNEGVNPKETNDIEFPFDGVENFIKLWTKENVLEIFKTLNKIDKIDKINVETISSEFFKYNIVKNKITIEFNGKRLNKHDKYIFTYGKLGPFNNSQEKDTENNDNLIWTQSVKNGKVIGISAIDDTLSNVAKYNCKKNKFNEKIKFPEYEKLIENNLVVDKYDDIKKLEESTKTVQGSLNNNEKSSVNDAYVENNIDGLCKSKTQYDIEGFYKKIYEIRNYQKNNWKSRIKHFKNVDRIAFFQFVADDSYQHPVVEICKQVPSKDGIREKNSCAEYRRRQLLECVMDACADFSVEILLLPEYSVRPETIKWMHDYLVSQEYTFSVWAGTFRIVPNYILHETVFKGELTKDYDWAAVLPVINNTAKAFCYGKSEDFNTVNVITSRFKKYPAISLQELINPKPAKEGMFQPVMKHEFNNVIFGDARDDVTELICAEMFMMTSPSNMNALLKASYELYNRLNATTVELSDYKDTARNDLRDFGDSTAIYQELKKYGRTPIILVPAYTTRATDYYINGQAGYLASGLTTVFCNAAGRSAIGGSCFIGENSWDDTKREENVYLPNYSPYHGISPGIFQQFSQTKDRGVLGEKEQALLICDINPNVSFKGKPNPETLGKNLELVAHLPIIEFAIPINRNDSKDKSSGKNLCRCQKVNNRKSFYLECLKCEKSDRCLNYDEILKNLIEICNHITDGKQKYNYSTTAQDENSKVIEYLFKSLGNIIDSEWLVKRGKKYEEQHINNPHRWPAPTLLDWIFVKVDYNDYEKNPRVIYVPKFK